MFDSLFAVKINWFTYFMIALGTIIIFPDMSLIAYLAFLVTLHQFFLLFYSLNHIIPIRYLFGTLMCVQMFIGPILAYGGFDKFQYVNYQMKIPETEYFTYVFPAVLCFIIGLNIRAGKFQGEILDQKSIMLYAERYPNLSYYFIAIGLPASVIAAVFPPETVYIFYLISGLKFVGAFLLIIGTRKLKVLPLILVWGSIIISSLGNGMFHDLLIWIIMLGAFFALKFKPSVNTKLIFFTLFILLAVIIQQLKGKYRTAINDKSQNNGLQTFSEVYEQSESQNQIFNYQSLAVSSIRINQGFIITNIMRTVPSKVPFSNGAELMKILEAAIFPRFLVPNKLMAGDHEIFAKYTDIFLNEGTSMGLSSVGDAYINYGIVGGSIFMFFLGLIYNEALKLFYKYSDNFPILLLFVPLVFYYLIRPDCELQTILGHFVKSSFLIFVIFQIWKKRFYMKPHYILNRI